MIYKLWRGGMCFFFAYRGWRLWTNFPWQAVCSPLRWSSSGLNETSILNMGPTKWQWWRQNGGPYSGETSFFYFVFGRVLFCFCRSEEKKTCPIEEDPLLPSAFKTRCFFSLKKILKRLPHISQWSLPISKYTAAKQAVLEFVCYILKGSPRIRSFWQGTLCKWTVKDTRHLKKITVIEQDGFEANPTNWARWLWDRLFCYSQENSEYSQWLRVFF